MNSTLPKILLATWLLARAADGMASPAYAITDLGSFGGASVAYDINNSGQVVGVSNLAGVGPGVGMHAFLYSGGVLQDIGSLMRFVSAGSLSDDANTAYGINDSGQVVGYSLNHGAFLYSGGAVSYPDFDGANGRARAINNNGEIVGGIFGKGVPLYSGGKTSNLGTLGGVEGIAYDINDSGQVVGWASTARYGEQHAFLYSGGAMQDLAPASASSSAVGINNSGQVVGAVDGRAFLYSGGIMQDLGGGTAWGINNLGQVVGEAGNHAFLYSGGVHTDLTLLMVGTGWTLLGAEAINDAGQIVGYGINPQGNERAFLLTPQPVPVPAAAWLFGSALAAAGVGGRRRKMR